MSHVQAVAQHNWRVVSSFPVQQGIFCQDLSALFGHGANNTLLIVFFPAPANTFQVLEKQLCSLL